MSLERIWETTEEMEKIYQVEQNRPDRLNIHLVDHQVIAKRFIAQTAEELVEFAEAVYQGHTIEHKLDEVADTMNMLTSLAIMCDVKPNDFEGWYFYPSYSTFEEALVNLNMGLFQLANLLKLRPWKRDGVLTDVKVFTDKLKRVFWDFYGYFIEYGELDEIMEKKNETNKFRLKSRY